MLNNFFKINLPYGIMKNDKDEWIAFNREYQPLGINKSDFNSLNTDLLSNIPLYTKYKGLTENKLISLAYAENGIHRNEKGEIWRIYFYNDKLNPTSKNTQKELWDNYFEKIKSIASIEVKTR